MALRKILTKEDEVLHAVCKPVEVFDEKLAQDYDVLASPTMVFFKNGEEINRIRGLKKKNEIEEILNIRG